MTTSVALGKHFESFIARQLETGRFNNASEVLRAALRLMEDQERLLVLRENELTVALQAARESGVAGTLDEVVARGKERLLKRAKGSQRAGLPTAGGSRKSR